MNEFVVDGIVLSLESSILSRNGFFPGKADIRVFEARKPLRIDGKSHIKCFAVIRLSEPRAKVA